MVYDVPRVRGMERVVSKLRTPQEMRVEGEPSAEEGGMARCPTVCGVERSGRRVHAENSRGLRGTFSVAPRLLPTKAWRCLAQPVWRVVESSPPRVTL